MRIDGKAERTLKAELDKLYRLFDRSFISPDPLECVPLKGRREDIELSAFIASVFAYGRADLIVKNVSYILSELGPAPCKTLLSEKLSGRFKNFRYRFHKKPDLIWLLERLKKIYEKHGSLENAFVSGGDSHIERLYNFPSLFSGGKALPQQRSFLITSPKSGAACKRMNLFLRWMARKDSLDIGLWKKVKPSELIIPLDVHVNRIAERIGLAKPGPANFKKAVALTENLRAFDPDDPVRYDFAICSLGKLGHCEKNVIKEKCIECALANHCSENRL